MVCLEWYKKYEDDAGDWGTFSTEVHAREWLKECLAWNFDRIIREKGRCVFTERGYTYTFREIEGR